MSKLTREDKIEIYERRKKGETISSLANSFYVSKSTIELSDAKQNDKNFKVK